MSPTSSPEFSFPGFDKHSSTIQTTTHLKPTMPPILERMESSLGRLFYSFRARDAKLFTKSTPFATHPNPTIIVSSPECGSSSPSPLHTLHTPLGANQFPEIIWSLPPELSVDEVKEYLLVVEDPDAPLPSPVVHGIYYSIPPSKTTLSHQDFGPAMDKPKKNDLRGGFKHGQNRMKSVWGGALSR